MKKSRIIKFSIFVLALYSCTMPSNEKVLMTKDTSTLINADTIPEKQSQAKLELFNEINATRDKLSQLGIGDLGQWKSDEMGGYMSITNYFQFGNGDLTNNLAIYLESHSQEHIEILRLVLNINNGDNENSLQKFSEVIGKTYTALGLKKIIKY